MSLMDGDNLEDVNSESEEKNASDETDLLDTTSSPISLQSRVYKYLFFFREKLTKVIGYDVLYVSA